MYKVGIGYDIHRLLKGRKLFIGGVKIPFFKGLKGHSDGDVLIHSICDAIAGCCGFKDIGSMFPDTDKKFKNISSDFFLKKYIQLLKKNKIKIMNIDCLIIAENPKFNIHYSRIINNLRKITGIKNISIKAKTREGLGEVGKSKAIECYTVVLCKK